MHNSIGKIEHASSSQDVGSNQKLQDIKIRLDDILQALSSVLSIDDINTIDPVLAKQIKRLLPEFRSGNIVESILFRFSPRISGDDQEKMIFRIIGIAVYKSLIENIKHVDEDIKATKKLPNISTLEIIFSLYSSLERLHQGDLVDSIDMHIIPFLENISARYVKTYQNLFLLDMRKKFQEPPSYYLSIDEYRASLVQHLPDRYGALENKSESTMSLRDIKGKIIDFSNTTGELTHIYFALNKANTYPENENIVKLLHRKYLPNIHP